MFVSGRPDSDSPHVALAASWINAGQALRRAQDIGLHVSQWPSVLGENSVDIYVWFVEITKATSAQPASERDQKAGLVVCLRARPRAFDGLRATKRN